MKRYNQRMLARIKKLPTAVIVGIMLFLLYPALLLWEHSLLKARIVNDCLDPRKNLENCYLDYYQNTAKTLGTKGALAILHERKQVDAKLSTNCHEPMHEIGRVAFVEYGSVAEAYAHADYTCWGGYLHGVVEAAFRGKHISDISSEAIRSLCDSVKEKGEKSFEYFSCVHGLGHSLMFVSDNDLLWSLTHCDNLSSVWETRQCQNGAFMQNLFSNYNDHASEFAATDDLHFPCSVMEERFQDVCYQVQGKLILDRTKWNFTDAFHVCTTIASSTLQSACASGLGAGVSNFAKYDPKRVSTLCAEAAGPLDDSCLYGALTDLEGVVGDTSLGEKVCALREGATRDKCLNILSTAHQYFPGKTIKGE